MITNKGDLEARVAFEPHPYVTAGMFSIMRAAYTPRRQQVRSKSHTAQDHTRIVDPEDLSLSIGRTTGEYLELAEEAVRSFSILLSGHLIGGVTGWPSRILSLTRSYGWITVKPRTCSKWSKSRSRCNNECPW
jgi:hypothetical protein